mmetsp:Transcript_19269/g.34366  ORF Transcript_19269/g.34366 Transcript_19269/m.34366 type:complete len:345 (-) Transcript_19269:2397-3431(-)
MRETLEQQNCLPRLDHTYLCLVKFVELLRELLLSKNADLSAGQQDFHCLLDGTLPQAIAHPKAQARSKIMKISQLAVVIIRHKWARIEDFDLENVGINLEVEIGSQHLMELLSSARSLLHDVLPLQPWLERRQVQPGHLLILVFMGTKFDRLSFKLPFEAVKVQINVKRYAFDCLSDFHEQLKPESSDAALLMECLPSLVPYSPVHHLPKFYDLRIRRQHVHLISALVFCLKLLLEISTIIKENNVLQHIDHPCQINELWPFCLWDVPGFGAELCILLPQLFCPVWPYQRVIEKLHIGLVAPQNSFGVLHGLLFAISDNVTTYVTTDLGFEHECFGSSSPKAAF